LQLKLQNMKYIVLISLALCLVACGEKSIIGKWKIQSMYQNGKLSATTDKAKQKKLMDSLLVVMKPNLAMFQMTEQGFKDNFKKGMKEMEKSSLTISKNNLTFGSGSNKEVQKPQPCKIDEAKKIIKLIIKDAQPGQKIPDLKYSFNGNVLQIRSKQIGFDLVQ
jgi:predicted metalloprotease